MLFTRKPYGERPTSCRLWDEFRREPSVLFSALRGPDLHQLPLLTRAGGYRSHRLQVEG